MISLNLSEQQIQIILNGLGELPAKYSIDLIIEINKQVKAARDE